MADSGAIRAGRAFVELFADDGPLQRGLATAQRKLATWGKAISQAGLALIVADGAKMGAAIAAGFKFADVGAELADLSASTGETVEHLSALRFALGDTAQAGDAIKSVRQAMLAAKEGSTDARQAFARLGVSLDDLQNASATDQLRMLADGFSGLQSETVRAQLATQIFGGSANEMMRYLRGGSAALDEATGRARQLGLIIGGEDAAAGKEFTRVWKELKSVVEGFVLQVGAAVMPMLKDVAAGLVGVLAPVLAWVKENRALIVTVLAAAAAGVALGIALYGLGVAVGVLSAALGVVIIVFKVLFATVAFLLSPLGLVVVAIAGVTAALIYFTDSWDSVAGFFTDTLAGVFDFFSEVWGGIRDAIEAGDIELAFKIVGLAIYATWTYWVNSLLNVWGDVTTEIAVLMTQAFYGWRMIFVTLGGAIGSVWDAILNKLQQGWINFSTKLQVGWTKVKAFFLGEDSSAQVQALESARQSQLAALSAAQRDRMAEAQAEVERLGAEGQAIVNDLRQTNERERAARDAEVDAAMAELSDAVNQAHQAREDAEAGRQQQVADVGIAGGIDNMTDARKKLEARGTFSGAELSALAGGETQEGRNIRLSREYLEQILAELRGGQPVFGP